MELHTARLLLRDFTPEDLADFTAYRSDPRSTEFSAEPKTEPASEALLAWETVHSHEARVFV